MKNKIILYLFIFSVLYIVFQYMNAKKADKYFTEKVASLEIRVDSLKAENARLFEENRDLSYFSLTENHSASGFFEHRGIDVEEVAYKIEDQIIGMNGAEDNPLVPFPGMEGPMRVNHIKILNHRWILADFSDGTYWGDMLLEYYIDEEGNLSMNTLDGLLYGTRS